MKIILRFAVFLTIQIAPFVSAAQTLPDSTIQKIDHIFSKWKSDTLPGCVTAIVMGNQIVYSKGFGLANLEDNVPNRPESAFYLASVAKQFTGYAIALLIREGKLALDDDIHKYLPWLADFKHKITIANLLHHTSGLRDDLNMVPFTGFHMDGVLSQDLALSFLSKQRTLNFLPGEKFSYCNSNYILLAEIVKQTSGKSFQSFVDSAIFKPLGMSSSKFVSSRSEIVKNRANSYSNDNGTFINVPVDVYTRGDGGMYGSANEMAKWATNFFYPKAGELTDIKMFTAPGMLNNGKPLQYAMGIIPDIHRGQNRLWHKGGLAGYKNFVAIYPDLEIAILILGNSDQGPKTNAAMEALAKLLVPMGNLVAPDNQAKLKPAGSSDVMDIKKFAGDYVAHNGTKISLSWKNGMLYAGNDLLNLAQGSIFYVKENTQIRYRFGNTPGIDRVYMENAGPNPALEFRRVRSTPKDLSSLKRYTGTYKADEIDYWFTISIKDGKLVLANQRHGPTEVVLYGPDDLYTGFYFMDHLAVIRDKRGGVTGLEFASGDTAGLVFTKQ